MIAMPTPPNQVEFAIQILLFVMWLALIGVLAWVHKAVGDRR